MQVRGCVGAGNASEGACQHAKALSNRRHNGFANLFRATLATARELARNYAEFCCSYLAVFGKGSQNRVLADF